MKCFSPCFALLITLSVLCSCNKSSSPKKVEPEATKRLRSLGKVDKCVQGADREDCEIFPRSKTKTDTIISDVSMTHFIRIIPQFEKASKDSPKKEIEALWLVAFGFFLNDELDESKLSVINSKVFQVKAFVHEDHKPKEVAFFMIKSGESSTVVELYNQRLNSFLKGTDETFIEDLKKYVTLTVIRKNFEAVKL